MAMAMAMKIKRKYCCVRQLIGLPKVISITSLTLLSDLDSSSSLMALPIMLLEFVQLIRLDVLSDILCGIVSIHSCTRENILPASDNLVDATSCSGKSPANSTASTTIDKRFRLNPSFPNFEILSLYSSFIWYPLDAPPFLRGKFSPDYSVAFLNESNKILGWELEKPGVFCFDVNKRSDGWTKIHVPLENYRKPFIVHGCNPSIGDYHVMFTYKPDNQPLVVSAFFMSTNFDNFQPLINKSIELPTLCLDYLLSSDGDEVESDVKHMMPTVSTDFEFVNLGHQQVGLVLHKYFEDDPSQGKNTGIVLIVTFEYDVIVSVNNNLEINTRFLGTRRYRYCTRQLRRKNYNNTQTCCKYHKEKFDRNYIRDIYSVTRQVHLNAAFQL